jgi:hypothetical protein
MMEDVRSGCADEEHGQLGVLLLAAFLGLSRSFAEAFAILEFCCSIRLFVRLTKRGRKVLYARLAWQALHIEERKSRFKG